MVCHITAKYIALAAKTVHSTQWSQILAQNRHFCLPHLHSTAPLGGFPSEYCHAVWYGKTRMVRLPDDEKNLKIYLFVLTIQNVTDTHTDTRTYIAWRPRPRLHSIARQKARETICCWKQRVSVLKMELLSVRNRIYWKQLLWRFRRSQKINPL